MRQLSPLEIAERDDPQGNPRPSLVAQLVVLDEAAHRHVAELLGKDRRARHLGAELGIGEAECEGETGPADGEPERSGAERKAKSERSEDERHRHARVRLGLEREIGDDAAREQHRDPQEPAVDFAPFRHGDAQNLRGTRSSRPCPYPASTPMLHHARILSLVIHLEVA